MGTPAYMAPELALATGIGPWTDLYSTGVIAYELLVGRLPFDDRDTPMAVLLRHIQDPIPSPRSVNPELDERLAAWLERMLEKDPERRPAGAAEAWEEFEEIVLAILGPRWRRQARLVERPSGNGAAARTPTTPAPSPVPLPLPQDSATQLEAPPTTAAPEPAPVPAPAPERRRFSRPVVVGFLGALGATAGTALAIALIGFDETAASPTQTAQTAPPPPPATTATQPPAPPPPAPARPVVDEIAIAKDSETVKATVAVTGAKLTGGKIVVNDAAIADGEASFVLWKSRVATQIGRRSAEGLTVAVNGGKPSRLTFTLTAGPGVFSEMSDPRIVGGSKVEVSLTETPVSSPPPPVSPPPPPPPPSTPDIG